MNELDENIGKIYVEGDYYFLEKIYASLADLINEEPIVKKRAKNHSFKLISSKWFMELNPFYHIETILNKSKTKPEKNRYRLKIKLKYNK
tara:strand:+ start:4404 stop:4673 length:270 start_codon:yes stop_codon:yes gene_type:complete